MREYEKLITIFSINGNRKVFGQSSQTAVNSVIMGLFLLFLFGKTGKLTMNNILWIYKHPQNSACKLIKERSWAGLAFLG